MRRLVMLELKLGVCNGCQSCRHRGKKKTSDEVMAHLSHSQ